MSYSSGGWIFKIKVLADLVSGEDPLPGSCSFMAEGTKELFGGSFIKALNVVVEWRQM